MQTPKNNKFIVLSIFVLFLFFGLGFIVGMGSKTASQMFNSGGQVQISKIIDLYQKTRNPEVSFDQYWTLWDKVKQKYVGDVNEVDLFYGSLEGMVAGLNDPYSSFFSPEKADSFAEGLSGEFEGIGAEVGIRDNQLTVVAPLEDSPAMKAGLKAGDKIVAIDGEDTYGMSVEDAVTKLRGEKGTEVLIMVTDNGLDSIKEVSVIRDTIDLPTVEWEQKDNNIIYLRISYFNENTWPQFDLAIKDILLLDPKAIILDLRSNPGGFVDTALKVSSEWIEKGVIVKEKFNDEKLNEYKASGKSRFKDMLTVILVDEGSASASEIVTGALQDYDLATIIGQKTFGKGTVQTFEVFPDGSALKLTVAKWYTPKDRQIEKEGIEPDVLITEMFVQKEGTDGNSFEDYIDKGLEKALEILN